jgi:hypothetical protein
LLPEPLKLKDISYYLPAAWFLSYVINIENYTSKGNTRVLDTTAPTAPAVASASGDDFMIGKFTDFQSLSIFRNSVLTSYRPSWKIN